MSPETRWHETTYGRYQRPGGTEMEERFFPTLWRRDGYRSPELTHYLDRYQCVRQEDPGWCGLQRAC